jgi:MFS family permease
MTTQDIASTAHLIDRKDNPPLDLLRNKLAFGGDSMLWGIGVYFIPLTTVITALAAELTTDKALIGLISLAWYVAYLLPQLFAARLVHGKRRTKPYAVIPSIIGRPVILLFALWLFFTRAQQPTLTVWLLIGMIATLMVFDALATQAWFDMIGRALAPRARARVFTVSQLLAAIGGIGAGLIVARVLASDQLPFPTNYAVLFALAWLFITLSLVAMLLIKERVSEGAHAAEAQRSNFNARLRIAWRSDPAFRRMLLARLFTGVENMAAAFYVVFAIERLGLPEASIGVFTIAYVIGGLLGIILFGWLADRFDSRRVISAACTLQFIAPLITFILAVLTTNPQISNSQTLPYVALTVVLALNGAVNRSMQVGFFSYAQDSAPEVDRPIYVGAVSTIAGTASLLPLLGGVLIDSLTRAGFGAAAYTVLFGLAAVGVGFGAWLSYGLPKPRRV